MIGFVGALVEQVRARASRLMASLGAAIKRARPSADLDWSSYFGLGANTNAGVAVDERKAMTHANIYACVRILAESHATLPLHVYERTGESSKRRATEHPLYRLLHRRANKHMTSFTFRETMMGHLVLRGNAYAEKVFDGAGRVVELWPLHPDWVVPAWHDTQGLVYEVSIPTQAKRTLPSQRVLHLRGLSEDGIVGMSPIAMARECIGLSMAAEEFGARLFGNGSRPGGLLTVPGKLGDEGRKRLKRAWEEVHSSLTNAHRVAVLENGVAWQKVGIDPNDAQFLETRSWQLQEIARLFRVPLHLLQHLENASYATVEQQGIDFVVHSMLPWCTRIEQEYLAQLFPESDQERYFPEHMLDGLLRGDQASRYAAYAIGRQWGWLSVNEIRARENLNPIDGGDVFLQPMNMVDSEDPDAGSDPEDDEELSERQLAEVRRVIQRARLVRSSGARSSRTTPRPQPRGRPVPAPA